jgi:hypothetical protein
MWMPVELVRNFSYGHVKQCLGTEFLQVMQKERDPKIETEPDCTLQLIISNFLNHEHMWCHIS